MTPYLTIKDAPRAIEFYKQAFGADVRAIHHAPDGKIMSAHLKIGDSILLLNEGKDGYPEPAGRVTG